MAKRIFSREFKFVAVRSVKETTSPPGLGTVGKTLTSGKRCCRPLFFIGASQLLLYDLTLAQFVQLLAVNA